MQRYLQCAEHWMIDHETHQFVMRKDAVPPAKIDVPFFLWPEGYERTTEIERDDGTKLEYVSVLKLNKCAIWFNNWYQSAVMSLKDSWRGGDHVIEISALPRLTNYVNSFNTLSTGIAGIDYMLKIDGEEHYHDFEFQRITSMIREFECIPNVVRQRNESRIKTNFKYGIVPEQFRVSYKDRWLNGKSYALLCGPWAVLLNDSLEFDSLAFLKGARPYVLDVDRFGFTVNPYILKMMFMS